MFPVSIAPMMDYTDRYFRMLMRLLSPHAVLYTEMISTKAILRGNTSHLLEFSPQEKPLILQVGSDNVEELAECTRIAADFGYDEININLGCPSERVHKGSFGASLMAYPEHVGTMITAMKATNTIPVGVKCRLGIDGEKVGLPNKTSFEELCHFTKIIFESGADRLIVHARIAILGGLSPKENREIPPLQYPIVYNLASQFPQYRIEINGGITNISEIQEHLTHVQGVMLGRIAIRNPVLISDIDSHCTHTTLPPLEDNREILAQQYAEYLENMNSVFANRALRHLIPLYNGIPGAKKWRRALGDMLQKKSHPVTAVEYALTQI